MPILRSKSDRLPGIPRRNKNGLRFNVTPFFVWWALLDLNQRPTDYESRCDNDVMKPKTKKLKEFSAECRPARSQPNRPPNPPSEEAPILLRNSNQNIWLRQFSTELAPNVATGRADRGDYPSGRLKAARQVAQRGSARGTRWG